MIRSTARLGTLVALLLAASGCDNGSSQAQSGCSVASLKGAYDNDPDNPYELFLDPSGEEFAYMATAPTRVAAGYERRR